MGDVVYRFLFWFENYREGDTDHQGKGGKDKPTGSPLTNEETLLLAIYHEILPGTEAVDENIIRKITISSVDGLKA